LHQVERHVAQDWEIVCAVIVAIFRPVLVHDGVENPVKPVFNTPMRTSDLAEAFGRQRCAEQVIGGLGRRYACAVSGAALLTAAAEKSSKTRFGQPRGRSVAIYLQSGHPQTRDPVGIDRALPSEEFFYGQLIAAANFLQTDGAAAHGIDYHRLAPGDPALRVGRRQIHRGGAGARENFVSKQFVQLNVVVHGGIVEREILRKP
jgi:hypothetical protein